MTRTEVVERFFESYVRHDHAAMVACLTDDVHFDDYAFDIRGSAVLAMWHWFCIPYGDRKEPVNVSDVVVTSACADDIGARYRVSYLYGRRQRPVDYVIQSVFRLRGGRIAEQHDSFATLTEWEFASSAFGFPLAALAITPILRPRVRKKALASLEAFMRDQGYPTV